MISYRETVKTRYRPVNLNDQKKARECFHGIRVKMTFISFIFFIPIDFIYQ